MVAVPGMCGRGKGSSEMTGPLERGTCSGCFKQVAISHIKKVVIIHTGDGKKHGRCSGYGLPPVNSTSVEAMMTRLADLILNLENYIEARALERAKEMMRQ